MIYRPCWWLSLVAAALGAGCASTGAVPRPFPAPGEPPPTARPARVDPAVAAIDAATLTGTALALRGAPYRDGGNTPAGFDCSGFTQYVFWQSGVALPRDVKEQFALGTPVTAAEIAPGDLVFFTTVASGASHVGIAIGSDQFVHAPSSRGVVRVERLSTAYWSRRWVGARRINQQRPIYDSR